MHPYHMHWALILPRQLNTNTLHNYLSYGTPPTKGVCGVYEYESGDTLEHCQLYQNPNTSYTYELGHLYQGIDTGPKGPKAISIRRYGYIPPHSI